MIKFGWMKIGIRLWQAVAVFHLCLSNSPELISPFLCQYGPLCQQNQGSHAASDDIKYFLPALSSSVSSRSCSWSLLPSTSYWQRQIWVPEVFNEEIILLHEGGQLAIINRKIKLCQWKTKTSCSTRNPSQFWRGLFGNPWGKTEIKNSLVWISKLYWNKSKF